MFKAFFVYDFASLDCQGDCATCAANDDCLTCQNSKAPDGNNKHACTISGYWGKY